MTDVADASWTMLGPPIRGRACGSCTACCTQLAVQLGPDERKPMNVRCRHLSAIKRCSIYPSRPPDCHFWSCRWLFDAGTAGLKRPDLGGYIVDPMLDTVLAGDQPMEIVQVWIDPKRRDAHRAPELRAYLAVVANRQGLAAIVRWASDDAMILFAPGLVNNSEWIEYRDGLQMHAEGIDAMLADVAPGHRRFKPMEQAL